MSTKKIPTRRTDGKREQTTIAELLEHSHDLPSSVRIALEDYAAGEDLTAASTFLDDAVFDFAEYLGSVMEDGAFVVHEKDALPVSARDYVQEFVRNLAEETNVQVYNIADVMRAALPFMVECCEANSGVTRPDEIAVRTTIERFCTQQELSSFYQRRGFDVGEGEPPAGDKDYDAALTAATIIADLRTPVDLRERLEQAILNLSLSTQTMIFHPALVERALVVMFEAMSEPATGDNAEFHERDRKEYYQRLHDLLAEVEKGGTP